MTTIEELQEQVDNQGQAIVKVAKRCDELFDAMTIMSDSLVDITKRMANMELVRMRSIN